LSRDEGQLAFFRLQDGGLELAVATRDQSTTRVVTKLPGGVFYTLRWSPDGRQLALLHYQGAGRFATNLLIADVKRGELRNVAEDFEFQGVTWLANGSGLIVSSSQGSLMSYPPMFNLWTFPLDGGARTQLTIGESSYEFPDLGPQGILVASRLRAQSDVWRFPITGDPASNARGGLRITRQTGLVQTVTVSPDETEVAVLSDNGGHSNVWAASVAGGEMRPITREFDPAVVVAVPVWSPRGDWINFLSSRSTGTGDVTLWLVRPDGSEPRDLGIGGVWACWSGDGRWLYYSQKVDDAYWIRKVAIDGSEPVTVRTDDATGSSVAGDGSALYYAKILRRGMGGWDWEIRKASPESGPSQVLGHVSGSRVPAGTIIFHAYLSPDGNWLAMALLDGSTTNLWALSTTTKEWRKLTDFGERNVMIARRIAWSRDSQHIYASVSDVDSDIVMLSGLK
jgi:Tol biopolymer transport system component